MANFLLHLAHSSLGISFLATILCEQAILGAFAYVIITLLTIHYITQVFRSLGNKHHHLLMVMEDHVLLAAMKLSHGEDLRTTISCLHEGTKALEDVLTCSLEAFNWFDLSIPTDLLNCQLSQSLPVAEINYLLLLPNEIKNLVGLANAGGLASPPCTPKGFFSSASTIPQSPCINPQILEFGQLRINEDIPIVEDNRPQAETQMQTEQDREPRKHEEQMVQLDNSDGHNEDSRRPVGKEDSDGRNGGSRGKNREDKDAMGVKEAQEDKMEEDHEERGKKRSRKMNSKRRRRRTGRSRSKIRRRKMLQHQIQRSQIQRSQIQRRDKENSWMRRSQMQWRKMWWRKMWWRKMWWRKMWWRKMWWRKMWQRKMWWRKMQWRKMQWRKIWQKKIERKKTWSRLKSPQNLIYTGALICGCKVPTLPHFMSLQPELKSNLVAMQAGQNH